MLSTSELKTHVQCRCCGKTAKRRYKKTYPVHLDQEGNPVSGWKMAVRVFSCTGDCDEDGVTYTHDVYDPNGHTRLLLVHEELPVLPSSAFEYEMCYEDAIGIFVVCETFNDEWIQYDNLRDEHLFGIMQYMSNNGIYMSNDCENSWTLYLCDDVKDKFQNYQEVHDYLSTHLRTAFGKDPVDINGYPAPDAAYEQELYAGAFVPNEYFQGE